MKLIFNADDFGHGKGINLGIIDAYQNGVVRSTTIMAGKPGFYHAVGLAHQNPGLKIGVHLTLTSGKSVGRPYKTITDGEGNFFDYKEFGRAARSCEIDLAEVESEYEAQIQKVLAAGITPDHLDSHHHTHNLPGIVDIFLRLAKKYGAAVRIQDKALLCGEYAGIKTPDVFEDSFYDDVSAGGLIEILSSHSEGSVEVMCHPGYIDRALHTGSVYNISRAYELDILTGRELRDFIAGSGYTLSTFGDL
ncbi:MAG: chitin disaccharide deacetylase [Oscillospiraceae bacterium]|nr:chitin disaccharide deacetylase [Oscillospiraceae bacterium]